MADRPRGREKNVTGGGAGVHRRGSGLGSGPVGGGSFPGGGSSGGGGPQRSGGGGSKLGLIIVIAIVLLGGGGGLGNFLGGFSGGSDTGSEPAVGSTTGSSSYTGSLPAAFTGSSAGWVEGSTSGKLNRDVSPEARIKYTDILGGGKDTVTLMVYMCGTDLESKYGMGSNDLKEMMSATLSDKVNLLVYTGGCKAWKTNGISNSSHQIWQIKGGKMNLLEKSTGSGAMTDPANLTAFIRYCSSNYPANRNMLIFWDHGGGSLSGFGYDELYAKSGSMNLGQINQALSSAGLKFDFIGFDACLMATVETDLMCANYADYIIASEETEPGVGWYYTNWLTSLSKDTSMPTIELGQMIADDFVNVCAKSCPGQKTTLSLVDLAELSQTLPDDFKAFSQSTTNLIKEDKYALVSGARSGSREFAQSSAIDQIDLVHFAENLDTEEARGLSETLRSAVKYNRTSSNMTNAYGISVYFPYRKSSKVKTASNLYAQIGVDSEYSDCIREFAGLQGVGQAAGQANGGGMGVSPFSMLSGGGGDTLQSLESILSLVSGMGGFDGRALSDEDAAEYVSSHQLDASKLTWKKSGGSYTIDLSEEEWELVHSVDLSMFVDDGSGYVDLGLDNVFEFNDKGDLVADVDGTWLSINSQPVAYYHLDTVEDGNHYTISGRVPAMLNGERVNLILLFTDEKPYGYIAGADPDYEETTTETIARGLVELKDGDTVDFLCDYYSYSGAFQDSYFLGEPWVVSGEPQISNTEVGSGYIASYKFTDIYNNSFWSEQLP
ncbi:MAG: peptidase C11 [Lachnospiraceae bacterium]|nr:peptidase C11 [Lachnospiraceae bacterium]